MVAALGGPRDVLTDKAHRLPIAPVRTALLAARAGVVAAMDTRAIGLAVVALGGGRARPTDTIDLRVGFSGLLPIGTPVERHQPLAVVHAASEGDAAAALHELAAAITIADTAMTTPVVHASVDCFGCGCP